MAAINRSGVEDQAGTVALLWGARPQPTRGPKPALSLERIAQAAVQVADADGLAAVSMQRVATELGVTKMALYRYVPGKAELIALMVDTAAGQPPLLDRGAGGWRAQLGIGPDDCSQCSSATRGCWTPPSAPGSWDPTSSAGWRRPSPPSTARA